MPVIRITKEFSFEMAHALEGYDGACSQIHGHSYKLFITIKGHPIQNDGNPENGMVMDFGVLKNIVNTLIVDKYDHAIVLRESADNKELIKQLSSKFERIITTDYQPTCENMISRFAEMISEALPEGVSLYSIKLHETATSYAEWYAEDQIENV